MSQVIVDGCACCACLPSGLRLVARLIPFVGPPDLKRMTETRYFGRPAYVASWPYRFGAGACLTGTNGFEAQVALFSPPASPTNRRRSLLALHTRTQIYDYTPEGDCRAVMPNETLLEKTVLCRGHVGLPFTARGWRLGQNVGWLVQRQGVGPFAGSVSVAGFLEVLGAEWLEAGGVSLPP